EEEPLSPVDTSTGRNARLGIVACLLCPRDSAALLSPSSTSATLAARTDAVTPLLATLLPCQLSPLCPSSFVPPLLDRAAFALDAADTVVLIVDDRVAHVLQPMNQNSCG